MSGVRGSPPPQSPGVAVTGVSILVVVGEKRCWVRDCGELGDNEEVVWWGGGNRWWGGNKSEAASAGCSPPACSPDTVRGEQCRNTGDPSNPDRKLGNPTGAEVCRECSPSADVSGCSEVGREVGVGLH